MRISVILQNTTAHAGQLGRRCSYFFSEKIIVLDENLKISDMPRTLKGQ